MEISNTTQNSEQEEGHELVQCPAIVGNSGGNLGEGDLTAVLDNLKAPAAEIDGGDKGDTSIASKVEVLVS